MSDSISKTGYLAGATRLRRVGERLQGEGDKLYNELGISFRATWFATYHTLLQSNTPLTMQDIAASIGFTHITVKNIVRELEQAGYVKISPNPNDARSKHVSLTTKGKNLLPKLEPVWKGIAQSLEQMMTAGHPNFINIVGRIEKEVDKMSLYDRIQKLTATPQIHILDYKPSLKEKFGELVKPWLNGVLEGKLEEEDKFTISHPDKAYIETGGFVFFALHKNKVVGCVALKRLSESTFEFCKLYIDQEMRNNGIATKLIERCINRCKENNASELWLQTTNIMQEAHKLYYSLGFSEAKAPKEMLVLKRTQKIMFKQL
ncbi:MAG TPA: bifunctional helix-turn-helix transcriptional regulator/GNAT family N-acetyltransferase [Bacteroidia bacterium]